jgi:hypothetical protein
MTTSKNIGKVRNVVRENPYKMSVNTTRTAKMLLWVPDKSP